MTALIAITKARMWGTSTAWTLEPGPEQHGPGTVVSIDLRIVGEEGSGFHLIASPTGFFTADTWHLTLQEALAEALEEFGVDEHQWNPDPEDS